MRLPLQITFRNMEHSVEIEANIRERAENMDRFYDQIMRCHVVVEGHHKHHHKGNLYYVKIDLTTPNGQLVVSRETEKHHAHKDVYVAIRDAFDTARRQLEDYARRRRGQVKAHEAHPHGRISQLYLDEGSGKIETPDGREIYFHKNSVLNEDFDKLKIGSEVWFHEEKGDLGPQASTVHVIGKHHIVE